MNLHNTSTNQYYDMELQNTFQTNQVFGTVHRDGGYPQQTSYNHSKTINYFSVFYVKSYSLSVYLSISVVQFQSLSKKIVLQRDARSRSLLVCQADDRRLRIERTHTRTHAHLNTINNMLNNFTIIILTYLAMVSFYPSSHLHLYLNQQIYKITSSCLKQYCLS